MAKYDFLDGERIRKAHSVRRIEPIFESLATNLAQIPELQTSTFSTKITHIFGHFDY